MMTLVRLICLKSHSFDGRALIWTKGGPTPLAFPCSAFFPLKQHVFNSSVWTWPRRQRLSLYSSRARGRTFQVSDLRVGYNFKYYTWLTFKFLKKGKKKKCGNKITPEPYYLNSLMNAKGIRILGLFGFFMSMCGKHKNFIGT